MEKGELLDFSTQMKGALSADFRETHKGLTKLLADTSCRYSPKSQINIEAMDYEFMYAYEKSITLSAMIFTELTNTQ
jgi:hypothetical protein